MDIIEKKPYDKFPIEFNFNSDFVTNETIVSYAIACINTATGLDSSSIIIASSANTTPSVSVDIQNGVIGENHHIEVSVTTSLGNIYDKDVLIVVVEHIEGSFTKQPKDNIIVAADFSNRLNVGDVIATHTVAVNRKSDGVDVTASTVDASLVDGQKVLVKLKQGVDGENYQIVARVEV